MKSQDVPQVQQITDDRVLVSFVLRDQALSGEVTDADSIFFLGAFFLSPQEKEILKNKGGAEAFATMSDRYKQQIDQQARKLMREAGLEDAPDSDTDSEFQQKAKDLIDRQISDAVFYKVNNDGLIRTEAAQRIREIFPSIQSEYVAYEEFIDQMGCVHRKARIRLAASETLTLIVATLAGLNTVQEVVKNSAAQKPQKPVQQDLQKQLATASGPMPPPKGFVKAKPTQNDQQDVVSYAPATVNGAPLELPMSQIHHALTGPEIEELFRKLSPEKQAQLIEQANHYEQEGNQ